MVNYLTSESSLIKPIEQPINRFPGIFDKEHPEELLGQWLRFQVISFNQELPESSQDKIPSIYNDLYSCTIEAVQSWINTQKNASFNEKTILKYISYQDQGYKFGDRERNYILIRRVTVRQTEIVSLCRFHKTPDSLYIGVDSFILGKLRWGQLIIHNLVLLFIFFSALPGAIWSAFNQPGLLGTILALIIPALYAYWIWGDVIKGIRQGDSFLRSLRQRFPKRISNNSFDVDDSLIFLKVILPLIINSTKKAFVRNNLQIKELENYLDEISKNIQQQSFSINTGGGSIFGGIFGSNNKISS